MIIIDLPNQTKYMYTEEGGLVVMPWTKKEKKLLQKYKKIED